MTSTVNYRDTHFKQANLTPIRGKPTFVTFHELWNEIKANSRSVYSHLGGGTHGNLGPVLTAAQYRNLQHRFYPSGSPWPPSYTTSGHCRPD